MSETDNKLDQMEARITQLTDAKRHAIEQYGSMSQEAAEVSVALKQTINEYNAMMGSVFKNL